MQSFSLPLGKYIFNFPLEGVYLGVSFRESEVRAKSEPIHRVPRTRRPLPPPPRRLGGPHLTIRFRERRHQGSGIYDGEAVALFEGLLHLRNNVVPFSGKGKNAGGGGGLINYEKILFFGAEFHVPNQMFPPKNFLLEAQLSQQMYSV